MKTAISLFVGLLVHTAAVAAPLAPGDPAPPLATGEYVQGEPVKAFESGKVYIVEFWATWCGPCVATIPHVNEIQQKFADKGVVVIGQNVWERDEAKVKPFVEKMGDKMTYRVAMDDKSDGSKGKMAKTWMEAAKQNGIPSAFIIDTKGTIAWIGHPAGIKDELLEDILAGTFDSAAHAEATKKKEEAQNQIVELFKNFKSAVEQKDFDEAAKHIGELDALNDPRLKINIVMCKLELALKSGDGKAVGEHSEVFQAMVADMSNKNQVTYLLVGHAMQLMSEKNVEGLDPNLAVKVGTKANEVSEGKNGAVLSVLARAKFIAGDKEAAIADQTSAIEHAANDEQKAKYEKALASFKEGQLPELE